MCNSYESRSVSARVESYKKVRKQILTKFVFTSPCFLGSGIRDKHPGSATLQHTLRFFLCTYCPPSIGCSIAAATTPSWYRRVKWRRIPPSGSLLSASTKSGTHSAPTVSYTRLIAVQTCRFIYSTSNRDPLLSAITKWRISFLWWIPTRSSATNVCIFVCSPSRSGSWLSAGTELRTVPLLMSCSWLLAAKYVCILL